MRSALAFLTVLPLARADGAPGDRLGRVFFPAVGLLLGLAAWAALSAGAAIGGAWVGAVAALACLALLTGGLHLDALADCADGLLPVATRERRLEIMRDPRVGAFGVTALVLVLLGDAAILARLGAGPALVALPAAGAVSRLAMVAVLVCLPYVRPQGLGTAAAGRGRLELPLAALLSAPVLLIDWQHGLLALFAAALASLVVGGLATARIGGATGDVYGATCELAQLAALLAFLVHP